MTLDDGAITAIHLTVRGEVDGLDETGFEQAAQEAKANCPVSKALAAVPEITLDARSRRDCPQRGLSLKRLRTESAVD